MENKDKIIVVGDADTVAGFRLAGVNESFLASPSNAEESVFSALSTPNAGIVIVSDEVVESISHKAKKALAASTKPVVVTVPSRKVSVAAGGSIQELVKRAIGVELK